MKWISGGKACRQKDSCGKDIKMATCLISVRDSRLGLKKGEVTEEEIGERTRGTFI